MVFQLMLLKAFVTTAASIPCRFCLNAFSTISTSFWMASSVDFPFKDPNTLHELCQSLKGNPLLELLDCIHLKFGPVEWWGWSRFSSSSFESGKRPGFKLFCIAVLNISGNAWIVRASIRIRCLLDFQIFRHYDEWRHISVAVFSLVVQCGWPLSNSPHTMSFSISKYILFNDVGPFNYAICVVPF